MLGTPRFWESDDFIFGGLAWTDRANENVIYPSDRYGADRGVIVGAYCAGWNHDENPDAFAKLSHEERARISRDSLDHAVGGVACVGGLVSYKL